MRVPFVLLLLATPAAAAELSFGLGTLTDAPGIRTSLEVGLDNASDEAGRAGVRLRLVFGAHAQAPELHLAAAFRIHLGDWGYSSPFLGGSFGVDLTGLTTGLEVGLSTRTPPVSFAVWLEPLVRIRHEAPLQPVVFAFVGVVYRGAE